MRFVSILAIIQLTFTSSHIYAEDLLNIIRLAERNDAAYQAAIHRASSDKEAYTQAVSKFMPTVSFDYIETNTNQDVIKSANFLSPAGNDDFLSSSRNISFSQPLLDMESWERFEQSKNTVKRADAELLQAKQDLLLRVSEAYFLILERHDQLDTIRDEKRALNKHFTMASQRKRAGLGRTVDVDTAEARYLEAVAKEVELESRLSDSRYALAEMTGYVIEGLLRLSDDIQYNMPFPNNVESWLERATQSNPSIVAKDRALNEAEFEVQARRTQHYPKVQLVYTNGNSESQQSIFSEASDIDNERLEVRFTIPIFQGFYVNSRVRQAISDKFRARDELRLQQRENERKVRDAFRRINGSITQIKALSRSVEAQQRMLMLKGKGYKAGRFTLLEVLDAQKDLATQQQARTKARYDYVLNILRLKSASGVLVIEDIAQVNQWLSITAQDK